MAKITIPEIAKPHILRAETRQAKGTNSYNSLDHAMSIARDAAVNAGIFTDEDTQDAYDTLFLLAEQYQLASEGDKPEILKALKEIAKQIPQKERLEITRFMQLGMLATESIEDGERKRIEKNADEIMYDDLERLYLEARTAGREQEFLATLDDIILNKMYFMLVHTMHPTVFETAAGIELGSNLSTGFEDPVNQVIEWSDELFERAASKEPLPAGARRQTSFVSRTPGEDAIPDAFMTVMEEMLTKAAEGIKKGKPLTHLEQVTVPKEDIISRRDMAELRERVAAVSKHLVYGLSRLKQKYGIDAEAHPAFKITAEEIQQKFSMRDWGQSADSDGRPEATALNLAIGISKEKEGDTFVGATRDARMNAGALEMMFSAFTQVRYQRSRGTVHDGRVTNPSDDGGEFKKLAESINPDAGKKLFIKLSDDPQTNEDMQADFAKKLLATGNGSSRFMPEGYNDDIKKFIDGYPVWLDEFIAEENKLRVPADKIPDDTTFRDLHYYESKSTKQRNCQNAFIAFMSRRGYEMSEDGRFFWSKDPEFSRLLQGVTIPHAKDPHEEIELRNRLVDGYKRFVVLGHEIDKSGPEVADRHQIAEFSKPAHFYMMMKFFEEAGIIEIERKQGQDPVVTQSKMMIQPLIETMEDFENAPKIFQKLLDDPLVLSYYKAMGGKAHIMLGFSDGAKTSGCFASEWKIYRTMQTLEQMFADKGIELETAFSGRGRREARGGEEDFSQIHQLLPRSINQKAVFDVTTQSDQPVHMATSKHYGEVKIAQAVSGTIQGALRDSVPLTDLEQRRLESFEKAMDVIANKSAELYQQIVRDHPQSIPFIKSMIRNPFATSRPTIRLEELPKEDKNPFDGLRMITVEYAGTLAKLPFLDAGLKEALQFALDGGIEVLAKDGKTVLKGREAMDELYENFTPAKKLIDKASTRMRHFDPTLAEMWTSSLGTAQFGKGVIESLTGLDDLVKDIGGKKQQTSPHLRSEEPRPHVRGTQALISTCLLTCELGTDPKANAATLATRPDKDAVRGRVNLNAYSVMANRYGRPEPLTVERMQTAVLSR